LKNSREIGDLKSNGVTSIGKFFIHHIFRCVASKFLVNDMQAITFLDLTTVGVRDTLPSLANQP
jgi:hypothetical protein